MKSEKENMNGGRTEIFTDSPGFYHANSAD